MSSPSGMSSGDLEDALGRLACKFFEPDYNASPSERKRLCRDATVLSDIPAALRTNALKIAVPQGRNFH